MIYVIVVLTILVTSCVTQDLMTCSRTSDTFQLSSALPSTPTSTQIARPGKRGAMGPKGNTGLRGPKGQKGSPADERETNRLQERVAALEERLDTLLPNLQAAQATNHNAASKVNMELDVLRQSILATPESGWFNGLNGYQYKLTKTADTWERTRAACQALGGDLAVHGMQGDLRKYVKVGVLSASIHNWIGLNDLEEEGTFRWVDGTLSTRNNTAWKKFEPNGGKEENCCEIYSIKYSCRINDNSCSKSKKGICEKRLTS